MRLGASNSACLSSCLRTAALIAASPGQPAVPHFSKTAHADRAPAVITAAATIATVRNRCIRNCDLLSRIVVRRRGFVGGRSLASQHVENRRQNNRQEKVKNHSVEGCV